MSRVLKSGLVYCVAALTIAFMPVIGFAQHEHGGKEHAGAGTAAPSQDEAMTGMAPMPEVEMPAAPATPAPAAAPQQAPVAPPALKPIVITFTGDLMTMDTKMSPAMITIKDRYGVTKEISVPAEAKVMQGSMAKMVSDLKAGDKLTVEYTYDVATGKRSAIMIGMGEAAPSPAS